MSSERVYRTDSGSYTEKDLAVVVWLNPNHATRPQTRLLETITSRYSNNPMAFPTRSLQLTLKNPTIATVDNIADGLLAATQDTPLIVPLPLAREELGWTDFYVPTAYSEGK